jgi:chemotaxis protein CheX
MEDNDIQVFIIGALRYFESLKSETAVVIEPPFITAKERPFREYTGIIRVSGKVTGIVCFTATRAMLETILAYLHQDPKNPEAVCDLVGEIANTLSGNAREEFGSEFKISVPIVAIGEHLETRFPTDTWNYVIPIIWRSEKAYLLISLS